MTRQFTIGLLLAGLCIGRGAAFAQQPDDEDRIVAEMSGVVIHQSDVDRFWRNSDPSSFTSLRQELYDREKHAVDTLIGERLLAIEAAARQMPVDRLLAIELPARIEAPTDAQVRDVYERFRAGLAGVSFDQVKPIIVEHIENEQAAKARESYVVELRRKYGGARIHLEMPRMDAGVTTADPVIGSRDAPIEIVEYADFECPFCRQAEITLKALLEKFAGRVKLVWKDFPLAIHESATGAAEAARCAGEQHRFWEFHDLLFANQEALKPADLKRYAARLDLDPSAFDACVASGRNLATVTAGVREGTSRGIQATPTILVNGRMLVGALDFSAYEKAIAEEIANAEQQPRVAR